MKCTKVLDLAVQPDKGCVIKNLVLCKNGPGTILIINVNPKPNPLTLPSNNSLVYNAGGPFFAGPNFL